MRWEHAPHSKNKNYKLVASEKIDGEFYLHMIGNKEGSFICGINEVEKYNEELQEYVKDLLPKILSGVYDTELLDEELKEGN